ncbi:UNVERIFIED_CONTAM: hypothetical protein HDU68_007237 [Siphonaria sp. JEL0065]|nr:hypothetical protein HDU68_007237 [Siphonaria sp. JEL0065]
MLQFATGKGGIVWELYKSAGNGIGNVNASALLQQVCGAELGGSTNVVARRGGVIPQF